MPSYIARFVIETADRQLERTSSRTKNGTVQAKKSPRSRLFFECFNLLRGQCANSVFHPCSSYFNHNMPANALDHGVTVACEVLFERKLPTLRMLEATPGDRIDLRISSQPEERQLLNDRDAKAFLISSSMKQVLKTPHDDH